MITTFIVSFILLLAGLGIAFYMGYRYGDNRIEDEIFRIEQNIEDFIAFFSEVSIKIESRLFVLNKKLEGKEEVSNQEDLLLVQEVNILEANRTLIKTIYKTLEDVELIEKIGK